MLAGVMRESMKLTSACGDCFEEAAAAAILNFWFDDSVDAKFMRASIMPVENHPAPSVQPATSGGSKSCWPMLTRGDSVVASEKPVQPVSFRDRMTYSTGQE